MTTLQNLQPVYTSTLSALSSSYSANFQPDDIELPAWPLLPPGASYECQLTYIIAAIICLLEWIECLESGGTDVEVQACVDAKNAVFLARVGGCVAAP